MAVCGLLLLLMVVCPVVFRSSLAVRKSLLFMNWLNLPLFRNLSRPEAEFGLNCTHHFFIENEANGARLGAWHVLPKSRIAECDLEDPQRLPPHSAFSDDRQVILYLHGNGGARGGNHRRSLYQVLAYTDRLDYHVLAIDYRGYGDSTAVSPTATGLVEDAALAYDWLLTQLGGKRERITVWGHSLGTAVATYLVAQTDAESQPSSVVLEAPFNTIADAVRHHPLASLFSFHPLFEEFFVQPIADHQETGLDTESKIRSVHSHLLILHARDDSIIPFALGERLWRVAQQTRPPTAPAALFHPFDASLQYGHKGIFRDIQLPDLLFHFVRKARHSGSK